MVKRIIAACLAGGLYALSGAQSGPGIYLAGHTIKDQGITLKPWGSGTIAETDEVAFEGTTSVRIYSRNYFQGGALTFSKPVDVSKQFDLPNDLLEITFRTADSGLVIPGAKPGAKPSGGDGEGGGGGGRGRRGGGGGAGGALVAPGAGMGIGLPGTFPAMMLLGFQRRPGGGGGGGGEGGGGGAAQGGNGQPAPGQPQPIGQVENIRIIITTTDNLRSEFYVPIASSFSGDRGWRSTAFPLSAISGFGRTNKIIKEISISTDGQATMFIGNMRIVTDTTPISGDTNVSTINVGLGEKILLSARGFAGSTLLLYEWDFDDKDGIQIDATGPNVVRQFNKPGTYTITVTIRDQFGQKKAATKTIVATVNP